MLRSEGGPPGPHMASHVFGFWMLVGEELDETARGALTSVGDDGRHGHADRWRQDNQIGAVLRHFMSAYPLCNR